MLYKYTFLFIFNNNFSNLLNLKNFGFMLLNIHKKQNKKSLPPEKREKSLPPIIQPEKREKSLPPIIQPEKPLPPVQQTKKPSKLTAIPVKSTPSKKIKNKKKINKTKSKKIFKI